MYGRFKKAECLEPFSVSGQGQGQSKQSDEDVAGGVGVVQIGGSQSNWQPPDWSIEPRPGYLFLEVLKQGQLMDRINLEKKRHLFGRHFHTCDFVLDHQSVSRQHAVVVPHKNGSVYVIDLGSAHGTFVANERLVKDIPVELELGQSLRFAASTRTYILRKNESPPTTTTTTHHHDINLPPPPDPCDQEAIVAYNTLLNRYGILHPHPHPHPPPAKRIRKSKVSFKDQFGGDLVQVVGVSDGADIQTEPGPLGFKEGTSLVGKYESLVQITLIPKGNVHHKDKDKDNEKEDKGVTDKLQQVFNNVKYANTPTATSPADDLYGDSFSVKLGNSWAYSSPQPQPQPQPSPSNNNTIIDDNDNDNDDLFGD